MRGTKSFFTAIRNAIAAAVLCAALIGSLALAAKADLPAVDFTAPYTVFPADPQYTIGWQFTAVANDTITCVGWFDEELNGFGSSHDIGIWTSGGVLLGTQTIPASTFGLTTIGQFHYISLNTWIPITAGQSYVIAGTSGLDTYVTNVSNLTEHPSIDFDNMLWDSTGGTLAFPTTYTPGFDPAIFGPNFLLLGAPGGGGGGGGGGAGVPEPGPALTLAGVGVAALVVLRKRRKP